MHLLKHFKELTVRPKNAQELKGLILQLAVQGKLTSKWREINIQAKIDVEKLKKISKKSVDFLNNESKSIEQIDVPSTWLKLKFKTIFEMQGGSQPPKSVFSSTKKDGYVQLYQIRDFGKRPVPVYVPIEKVSKFCTEGDIMIGRYGASIGKIFYGKNGAYNVALVRLIWDRDLLEQNFVYQIFSSHYMQEFFQNCTRSAQAGFNKTDMGELNIPIPPIEEQKAIVEVVEILFKEVEQLEQFTVERISLKEKFVTSSLNQLTTNNAKKEWTYLQKHFQDFFNETNNIKKFRETVLQLAVQGKLTADWRANNPNIEDASVLLKRIQNEKAQLVKEKKIKDEKQISLITEEEIPYSLPESWVWCRMQDLCPNISSGSTPPKPYFKEEGVPYLKVYNIKNQKIDFDYRKQYVDQEYHSTKLKRSILKPGDVIMNIVGPPLGKVAIIPNDFPEWNCNQAISFFQPLDRKLNTWIYTYLLAGTFLDRIELIGTAGQDNISVTKSKTIMLPLPPFEEQKAIVQKVNALMGLFDALEQQVQQSQEQSEKLMQSCLREVFEGKAVEVIENA